MKIDNKGYKSDMKDELIEMPVDLEAKALFKSKISVKIGAMSILLPSTPSSEQQPNPSYSHSQLEAKALFKSKTSVKIGAMSILLPSTPSSEQQPNPSYSHSQLHTWLKLVLAICMQY